MKKRESSPIEYRLNVVFRVVLMMSANPRKTPELNGVVNSKEPEIFLGLLWPIKDKMKKRESGPIEDRLNMAFHVVLMMSANPRKTPELVLIVAISNPFFRGERMVIRGIVLQFDAVIPQKSFKRVFTPQGFSRREICLVSVENEICYMVNEYSFSNKLSQVVLLAQCVSQLSEGGGHILVARDAITMM